MAWVAADRIVRTAQQFELDDRGLFVQTYGTADLDASLLLVPLVAFLLCSFWPADALALMGRTDDAMALFDRLLALRNDVGLLAEGYDPTSRQLLGNFPQAFSHTAIVNTATTLDRHTGPTQRRARPG